ERLQRDGFAGAGRPCNKAVAIRHFRQQINRLFPLRDENWFDHKNISCMHPYCPGIARARFCQPPRTRPLKANARKGRPMLMKTRGQGLVSNAENAEMVEYSTKRKANQQTIAIFKPATAVVALSRLINHAKA